MVGKYTLVKHFWISCAHAIPGAGKCERVHGHNYKVTFCVEGKQLDPELQFLIDFREVKHAIEKKFDHHLLNGFPEFDPKRGGHLPTTEKVAEVFYNVIDHLCQSKVHRPSVCWVEIQETNEVYARYERVED